MGPRSSRPRAICARSSTGRAALAAAPRAESQTCAPTGVACTPDGLAGILPPAHPTESFSSRAGHKIADVLRQRETSDEIDFVGGRVSGSPCAHAPAPVRRRPGASPAFPGSITAPTSACARALPRCRAPATAPIRRAASAVGTPARQWTLPAAARPAACGSCGVSLQRRQHRRSAAAPTAAWLSQDYANARRHPAAGAGNARQAAQAETLKSCLTRARLPGIHADARAAREARHAASRAATSTTSTCTELGADASRSPAGAVSRVVRQGTTSKAAVSRRPPSSNGTVPCHRYDGNSTSIPGSGFTKCSGAACRAARTPGSPNLSHPARSSRHRGSSGNST